MVLVSTADLTFKGQRKLERALLSTPRHYQHKDLAKTQLHFTFANHQFLYQNPSFLECELDVMLCENTKITLGLSARTTVVAMLYFTQLSF